jgi:hypothetical protein
MRKSAILATVAVLALAGCGDSNIDKASGDAATRDGPPPSPVGLEIDSPHPQNLRVNSNVWSHNGSTVTLYASGESRSFYYRIPRSGLPVSPGQLLFNGRRIGDEYSGVAYRFSSDCGPISYQVNGYVHANQTTITMSGLAPRRDSNCNVVGTFNDELRFDLLRQDSSEHATSDNETLLYNAGKCLVVNQKLAGDLYAAIDSGRVPNDLRNRSQYEFTRRQAAYWMYQVYIISQEYTNQSQANEIANRFLNSEVTPALSDRSALSALLLPLFRDCNTKATADKIIDFAGEIKNRYPALGDEDPVGNFATEFANLPPL